MTSSPSTADPRYCQTPFCVATRMAASFGHTQNLGALTRYRARIAKVQSQIDSLPAGECKSTLPVREPGRRLRASFIQAALPCGAQVTATAVASVCSMLVGAIL